MKLYAKRFVENQSSICVVAGDVSVLIYLSSDGNVTHSCEDEWVYLLTGAIGQRRTESGGRF